MHLNIMIHNAAFSTNIACMIWQDLCLHVNTAGSYEAFNVVLHTHSFWSCCKVCFPAEVPVLLLIEGLRGQASPSSVENWPSAKSAEGRSFEQA